MRKREKEFFLYHFKIINDFTNASEISKNLLFKFFKSNVNYI